MRDLGRRIDKLERAATAAKTCPVCGGRPRLVVVDAQQPDPAPRPPCACGNDTVVAVVTGLPARSVDTDRPTNSRPDAPVKVVGRVDLKVRLRNWQARVAELRKRFSVVVAHRRAGKSIEACLLLSHEGLIEHRPAPHYGYVCPHLNQARRNVWTPLKSIALRLPGTTVSESDLTVRLGNGASIRLYGGDDPDSIRGIYFDGVVLDEYSDMKCEVLNDVVLPAVADRQGWVLVIGTPGGVDHFSTLYHRAASDPEHWYAGRFTAEETGALPASELELQRRTMDANSYAREYDCDFDAAGDDQLVPLATAREAMRRDHVESAYAWAPLVLGVDCARFGGDRSVIFPRRGLVAFKPRVMLNTDLMTLVGVVADMAQRLGPEAIIVDQTGIGSGVVDRLRELRFKVVGVDFGSGAREPRFLNRRAEMHWALRDWLASGGAIPDDEALVADLTVTRYKFTSSGQVQLESKSDIRKRGLPSPDLADALALTFAEPRLVSRAVDPRNSLPLRRGGQFAKVDYDLMAL